MADTNARLADLAHKLADLEYRRGELLRNAAEIVQAAEHAGGELTPDEDSHVLELAKSARAIEEKLLRLKRHGRR